METNNSLDIKNYKMTISMDSKKIIVLLENKEDSNDKYENNYSFEQIVEKQIKLVSCNNVEIILNLIKISIKENKYSILKDENKDILNISFQLKNAFDNSDIPLNISLKKIINSDEIN